MKSFTTANLDKVRNEINEALAVVNAKHGITIEMGNIRYASNRLSFNSKLTVGIGGADDISKKEFEDNCRSYGLKPSDFGKTFTANGDKFRVSGIKTRGKKYNVLADKVKGGGTYKFAATRVKELLK